jgi:hypothetical protein
LSDITGFSVHDPSVTDAQLKSLGLDAKPQLHAVRVEESKQITGQFLAGASLPRLGYFNASRTAFDDRGVALLAAAAESKVTMVYLTDTAITDKAMPELVRLGVQNTIDIGGTKVTDAGLRNLVALLTITELNVKRCQDVTPDGIAWLSVRLPKLKVESDYSIDRLSQAKLAAEAANATGQLRRSNIDRYELTAAGGGDPRKAPKELVAILGDSRLRHWDAVNSMAFHPDGKTLISGGWDRTVRFWDLSTGRLLKTMVTSTGFQSSADGRTLITGIDLNQIAVWDFAKGRMFGTVRVGGLGAVSPDGTRLVSGSTASDGGMKVIQLPSGRTVWKNDGHDGQVREVAWSPNGQFVVSGGDDGTVRVWNAETGEPQRVLEPGAQVMSIAVAPDGRLVTSGDRAGGHVWELATGKLVAPLKIGGDDCAYLGNGNYLITGGKVISTTDWKQVANLNTFGDTYQSGFTNVASPDSQFFAIAGAGHIRMLQTRMALLVW